MKIKALLYCCKAKPYLIHESGYYDSDDMCCDYDCFSVLNRQELYNQDISLDETYNGKIVAECDYEVEEIKKECVGIFEYCYRTKTLDEYDLMYKTQFLNGESMNEYLQGKGYAIHIKNLHIFDKPKELNSVRYKNHSVKSAPQNMMKVYDYSGEYYILISIRPEWLCKILNKEKTIEVRKKVLKEMLNNE